MKCKNRRFKKILSQWINFGLLLLSQFKDNLENIGYNDKRELLRMLINRAVIEGKDIDIHCNIPYRFAFAGQAMSGLSHNNKSFSLILHTKVAKIDKSEAYKNLFNEDGSYKKIPEHKLKGEYDLKHHLKKTDSERLKSKVEQIIGLAKNLEGTKIIYSKKRICFYTVFQYMTLEVYAKSLYVCVKNKAGWKCFNLKPNSHLGRIEKALYRIHGLSKKPRLTS